MTDLQLVYAEALTKIAGIAYDAMTDWDWNDPYLLTAQRRGAALERISEVVLDLEDAHGVELFD